MEAITKMSTGMMAIKCLTLPSSKMIPPRKINAKTPKNEISKVSLRKLNAANSIAISKKMTKKELGI